MTKLEPVKEGLDLPKMNKEFDKIRCRVFTNSRTPYAGFYASLLCGLDFIWTEDIPTASTNGLRLYWNPKFFLACSPELSETILIHELEHVAKLHVMRRGNRKRNLWNYACDIRINNELDKLGYSFRGFKPWLSHEFDKDGIMLEEDIYDLLEKGAIEIPASPWGSDGDIIEIGDEELTEEEKHRAITTVLTSVQQCELNGQLVPGDIVKTLNQFLNPVIPWEQVLYQFFNDLRGQDYSWRKPSRRSIDVYLPGMAEENDALEHILYVEDVSGSISDGDLVRFNSELKYVWDTFKPQKMTIIQFDTIIQMTRVVNEGEELEYIEHSGGGGTSLVPVREWIIENKPTAAVIFSDLECEPMDTQGITCPLIWVAIRNRSAKVQSGKLIHINR